MQFLLSFKLTIFNGGLIYQMSCNNWTNLIINLCDTVITKFYICTLKLVFTFCWIAYEDAINNSAYIVHIIHVAYDYLYSAYSTSNKIK